MDGWTDKDNNNVRIKDYEWEKKERESSSLSLWCNQDKKLMWPQFWQRKSDVNFPPKNKLKHTLARTHTHTQIQWLHTLATHFLSPSLFLSTVSYRNRSIHVSICDVGHSVHMSPENRNLKADEQWWHGSSRSGCDCLPTARKVPSKH